MANGRIGADAATGALTSYQINSLRFRGIFVCTLTQSQLGEVDS